jgi:hypothetical protein
LPRQSFPKLRCTSVMQFFCQTIEALNHGRSYASGPHLPLAVTKREQWQDPDT